VTPRLPRAPLALLLATLLAEGAAGSEPGATLSILESHRVAASEISGMTWRRDPGSGRLELVLVSDRDHVLRLVDWPQRTDELPVREVDLAPLEAQGAAQSEWESVSSDAAGRLYILQEDPARIVVVSPGLDAIEARIDLEVRAKDGLDLRWERDANARGEGLLLLKNGHVLVVKEKQPLRVIEFAPPEKPAEGYAAGSAIEPSGEFPRPARLVAVHAWSFAATAAGAIDDASGINVDADGVLYVLDELRRSIGRVGRTLGTGSREIELRESWRLPPPIEQPEGMVFDAERRPLIAIDRKRADEPNLFLLSPLP
jgi:hypothetical protein